MLIVLSPAKNLDFDTPSTTSLHSAADFLDHAEQLIAQLRDYPPAAIGELMDLSDKLSALNVARYATWSRDPADARQAVMAFNGDVYGGLGARSLTPKQLAYTQARVRILSGLYGLLRPLDLIHPHRLEMGTRLPNPRGKDLYAFWGPAITMALNQAAAGQGADTLVNLASGEYFKSVQPALLAVPVITPRFEDWKDGRYKIISFHAKRARGLMARYAAVKGLTDPHKLKKFAEEGYAYDAGASGERDWVFRRKLQA